MKGAVTATLRRVGTLNFPWCLLSFISALPPRPKSVLSVLPSRARSASNFFGTPMFSYLKLLNVSMVDSVAELTL